MAVDERDFTFVRDLMRQDAAIVLEPGKEYLVETRLEPLARTEGFSSLSALVENLRRGGCSQLHRKVVDAMTTNETSFFRDVSPFETLRRDILPEVIVRRAAERTLNIWCAACSTGQEPYSIAMLLQDYFPELAGWRVDMLGTDLCERVLERARVASYRQMEVNRGLPAIMLVKHFEKCGEDYRLREPLRRRVEFRKMNLASAWPPLQPMDVIFLRNVMIYFDTATKRSILSRLRSVLRPGGWLFLGGAETVFGIDDSFERVSFGPCTVYRSRA